ncbi:hypothetical protein CcI156_20860 [Frankia sp. CcI156]|jgi:cytochrome P450|uniref:Cytochrome P450 n=1 Tax=Frankia casuarinae (strain DSM 45818 / CECT 9043 / HFP020203 / CcI3) TaxID=106370 RepID=Q2J5I3_FRACC|nr:MULTISPECIES: cytochrome P450 [Frankia]ABD13459.1 putative cytochrome P450 [Frankia casuarinae]ETA00273.1 hypothetical protein CcI6DRAFT_04336 [Frankia sp. CcI6]EYT90517.1 hypothetical protein ThrDRAFT_03821 [Frankia casuarinae]KFB02915.1 Cytochrome P450 [Frankia sp. Allo2]ONH22632.1 hypothetical protein CcI156_20860 [Frankia sp. CcI156]
MQQCLGEAMRSLHDCAVEMVLREREEPGNGALGALTVVRDEDGTGFSDEELVSTVLLTAIAGYESTVVQIGNGFLAMFRHPEQMEHLKRGRTDIAAAVEEILRYAQSSTGFAGMTYAMADVELGSVTVPAGATVFVSLDSAARDEAHVDSPQRFELSRGSARHHVTFGSGHHYRA